MGFGVRQKKVGYNGGAGINTLSYNVTKSELDALVAAETLVTGATYTITDRGDMGLVFLCTSATTLDFENGQRFMLCPATYKTISDKPKAINWIGVWNPTKVVAVDDLAIWGGYVWQNVSGLIGASVDDITLDANWSLLDKDGTNIINGIYVLLVFGVNYDYYNDWICSQWDFYGNKIGMPVTDSGTSVTDYCSMTDWNLGTLYEFSNNICGGVFNNSNKGRILNNNVDGVISNNFNTNDISFNNMKGTLGQARCNISNNTNAGTISNNSIIGLITGNSNTGDVNSNSSIGNIQGNSNTGSIMKNSNNGNISNNFNVGAIQFNSIANEIINLVATVGDYNYNFADGSFDIFIPFFTSTAGVDKFYNCIVPVGTVILEMTAKGNSLVGGVGATLSFGLETNDVTYISASLLANVNNGRHVSSLSNQTTIANRRIIVKTAVANVTGGSLRINVKIL